VIEDFEDLAVELESLRVRILDTERSFETESADSNTRREREREVIQVKADVNMHREWGGALDHGL
jgi:hypothetical protein